MCNLYLFLIVFIVTFKTSERKKRNNYNNNKNNGRRCQLRCRLSISKNAREGQKSKRLVLAEQLLCTCCNRGGGGGRVGDLRILSDRDDRRILWGLKFSNSGFYLGRRILASNRADLDQY